MYDVIKQDKEELKLFRQYGYDIPKARKFILAKAKITKGSILEIGTGKGHMAIALAKKGFKIASIDVDKKAQSLTRKKLKIMDLSALVNLKTKVVSRKLITLIIAVENKINQRI